MKKELKQKYSKKAENINIEYVPSWSCFDKITNSFRKMLSDESGEENGGGNTTNDTESNNK